MWAKVVNFYEVLITFVITESKLRMLYCPSCNSNIVCVGVKIAYLYVNTPVGSWCLKVTIL